MWNSPPSAKMMYRMVVLACFISAINAASVLEKERIIGGNTISIEEAPYTNPLRESSTAGIQNSSGLECKRLEDGDFLNVIAVIKHKDYYFDRKTPIRDIALMRVVPAIDINGKTIKAIGLPEQSEKFTGQSALVSGWSHSVPGKPSNLLQSLTVKILTRETCDKDYTHFKGIRNGQICAEHPDRDRDFCNGDSGGPLVIGGKQVGIVSWSGPGDCAQPGRPGVYTEVAAYRDWIDEHIKV